MNKRIYAAVILLALSVAAIAQLNLAAVKGRATDENGQPYASAEIRMAEAETGRKYTLKTDKGGNYQSIAIQPGKYKMTLVVDGKEIYNLNGVSISLQNPENVVNFDMAKERKMAAASGQMTEEQKKQIEAAQKENLTIKDLNNLLAAARTQKDSGDTTSALATIDKAIAIDPSRSLLWYTKGDIVVAAARAETDRAAKKQKFLEAVPHLEKAVQTANASPDPKEKGLVINFNEGLAKAYEGAGDVDKAAASYDAAAAAALAQNPANPKQAASEYFNKGAVLTNANRSDEAMKAFDEALKHDPEKADAYYWKGVALMGKGELKDGKLVAPEGTAEAFNKYLELQPEGAMAQPAKDMLAAIGSEVQTSYRKGKSKSKTKN
jgi:tetratricopeptide (TPR) repeat protein